MTDVDAAPPSRRRTPVRRRRSTRAPVPGTSSSAGCRTSGCASPSSCTMRAVPCRRRRRRWRSRRLAQLHRWSVPVVRESSLSMASLVQAGIAQAAAVIAAHDADLSNLETALLVADLVDDDDPERRPSPRGAARKPALGRAADARRCRRRWCSRCRRRPGRASSRAASSPRWCTRSRSPRSGWKSSMSQATGEQSTLRSAFGDLTPLALRPADGGPLVVCPPRDYELSPVTGSRCIGRPDDYGRSAGSAATRRRPRR